MTSHTQTLRRALEAATMAKTRLDRFADEANAGHVHYDAHELKRKIGSAFADFDEALAIQDQPALRTWDGWQAEIEVAARLVEELDLMASSPIAKSIRYLPPPPLIREVFKCNCPHEVRSGCSEPRCPYFTPIPSQFERDKRTTSDIANLIIENKRLSDEIARLNTRVLPAPSHAEREEIRELLWKWFPGMVALVAEQQERKFDEFMKDIAALRTTPAPALSEKEVATAIWSKLYVVVTKDSRGKINGSKIATGSVIDAAKTVLALLAPNGQATTDQNK